MAQPKRRLKDLERYANLPMVTELGQTEEDWNDGEILFKDALPLQSLTGSELTQTVKSFLLSISTSMTEVGAYNILILCWNLRSKTDPTKRIFPPRIPQPVTGEVSQLSQVESVPTGPGYDLEYYNEKKGEDEFNRAGCFLAASLLKLFTKETGSWMKAQDHIAEKYKKFTDKDFILREFPVHESSIATLRRLYQTKTIFKKTLGIILYTLNQLQKGRGMTQMLFERHLSFTGLHIIGLFCRAVVGLRTTPHLLMNALHIKSVEPTLDQLAVIFERYMGSKEGDRERETYKYSRIYNPKMFSLLQTKNCSDIVCILGHIGKLCGNIGTGDVMEIAALRSMSAYAKSINGRVAQNIFNHFKVDIPAAENPMLIK